MSFFKNARVMLIGFALAQALPLLASPLLTRLFGPEAFGLQSLFVSSTSVLLVLATLRLDLATVLAGSRREALDIIGLAVGQVVAVSVLVAALLAFFNGTLLALGGTTRGGWMWAVVPMLVALALVQLSGGLLTWLKRFAPISQAQVLNQTVYLSCAVALGIYGTPVEGLVVAKLIGQLGAAIALLLVLRTMLSELRFPPRTARRDLWDRCKAFLFFNTPYSLIGVIGREVPIFAFWAVAAFAAAGFYGLARTLLWAPAILLAASLSQVFYREAAEHRGTVRLQELTFGLLQTTMAVTAPAFAFILVWGDVGFALAFGEEWPEAGRYAMILAVPAWLAVQTAWPERLFESVGRQGVSFTIQVSFDAVSAALIFTTVLSGYPPVTVVALFAVINSIFHVSYLIGMVRVSGFPLASLAKTLGVGALQFGLFASFLCLLRAAAPASPLTTVVAAILVGAISLGLAYRGYRGFQASSSATA